MELSSGLFYEFLISIIVSLFCGFLIGIERTRVSAQYGARDHIFFSIIATCLIILYESFLPEVGIFLVILVFGVMLVFLLIGAVYRLFKTDEPGYTTTLSMILAIIVGILSYYLAFLAIIISVLFLIILSTKKQFYKIQSLKDIEWTGTVEFIAIVVLLFILIPDNIFIASINLKSIVIIFISILAVKYVSYFLIKSSRKMNIYFISILGGLAHSEATTVELAEAGAPSSSIWLVIQTMLMRMLIVLIITPLLLIYALFPILITSIVGLVGSFLILRKKDITLEFAKIKNPLSIRGALFFIGTYAIAVLITVLLSFIPSNILAYYFIVFGIGLLSGGASSLFVATAFLGNLINQGNALLMLSIGFSGAIANKTIYSTRHLNQNKNKKRYTFHLLFFQTISILLLISMTLITLSVLNLPIL